MFCSRYTVPIIDSVGAYVLSLESVFCILASNAGFVSSFIRSLINTGKIARATFAHYCLELPQLVIPLIVSTVIVVFFSFVFIAGVVGASVCERCVHLPFVEDHFGARCFNLDNLPKDME